MRMTKLYRVLVFVLASASISRLALAASLVWTGVTDSNWSTTTNWSPNGTPGATDTATFNGAGNGNTTISVAGVTINTILFDTANAAAYTIGSGVAGSQTLTLANGGAVTMNAAAGHDELFNATINLGNASTSAGYTFTNNSLTKALTVAGNIGGGSTTGTKTLTIGGAGTTTISGAIGGGSGTIAVTINGRTTLSGTNTFAGALTVAGTLSVPVFNNQSAAGPLGNSTAAVTLSPYSSLQYTGASTSSTKKLAIEAGYYSTVKVADAAADLTLSGVVSGGTLLKDGPGTLILAAANTHSGLEIDAGTVRLSGTGTFAASGGDLFLSGGRLDLNGKSITAAGLISDIAGRIVNNGSGTSTVTNTFTGYTFSGGILTVSSGSVFNGVIADNDNGGAGVVALAKSGNGDLSLTNANTYSGATTISSGTIYLSGNGTLGNTTGATTVASGATLYLSGVNLTGESVSIAGSGVTLTGYGALTDGALETSGTCTISGPLALTAAAKIYVYDGTLAIDGANPISGGAVALTLGGLGSGSITRVISTTGSVTITDTAKWTLSGANTFTGALKVDGGARLIVPTVNNASTAGPLGNSATAVTLGSNGEAAYFEYTGGTASSTKPFALSSGGLFVIDSAATELTLGGLISGTSAALLKSGPGTLTLGGVNTYSGGTTVYSGTLRLSGSGRPGATTSSLTMQGGTFDLNGTSQTIGSLSGSSGTVLNNGGGASTLTINGGSGAAYYGGITDHANATTGTVALTKSGSGIQGLFGTTSYSGATNVSDGTLIVSGAAGLGTTAAGTTVTSGATLYLQGASIGDEAITIAGAGDTPNGAKGALAGDGSLGDQTFGGVLTLSAASTIAAVAGNFNITNPGTITGPTFGLTLGGDGGHGMIASIIGTTSGTLAKSGTSTWTLNGANTYTGATTISGGILNIQNASALGTTAGATTVSNGATLQIEGGLAIGAETLTISGAGASGATGALENVSGTNTFAGLLSLAAASTISSDAGSLSLTNTGIINDAFNLTLTGAGDGAIASVIGTGAHTVTKTGNGTWTLSGTNTFTGALAVQSGTLSVPTFNSASSPGPLGNGATAVALGAASLTGTLEYTGGSTSSSKPFTLATSGGGVFQIDLAATELTLTGAITGSGTFEKAGLGTLTLGSSKAFTGSALVSEGTLKLSIASAISGSSGITVETGGVLLLAGTAALNRITDTIPLTLSGGTLSMEGLTSGTETLGNFSLTLANSTIDFGNGSGDSLFFTGVGAHTTGIKLAILNWSGTPNQLGGASSDRLLFTGANPNAFTTAYHFADVSFNGVTGYLALQADATHYEIVAIPEPTTGVLLGAMLLGAMTRRYRRK